MDPNPEMLQQAGSLTARYREKVRGHFQQMADVLTQFAPRRVRTIRPETIRSAALLGSAMVVDNEGWMIGHVTVAKDVTKEAVDHDTHFFSTSRPCYSGLLEAEIRRIVDVWPPGQTWEEDDPDSLAQLFGVFIDFWAIILCHDDDLIWLHCLFLSRFLMLPASIGIGGAVIRVQSASVASIITRNYLSDVYREGLEEGETREFLQAMSLESLQRLRSEDTRLASWQDMAMEGHHYFLGCLIVARIGPRKSDYRLVVFDRHNGKVRYAPYLAKEELLLKHHLYALAVTAAHLDRLLKPETTEEAMIAFRKQVLQQASVFGTLDRIKEARQALIEKESLWATGVRYAGIVRESALVAATDDHAKQEVFRGRMSEVVRAGNARHPTAPDEAFSERRFTWAMQVIKEIRRSCDTGFLHPDVWAACPSVLRPGSPEHFGWLVTLTKDIDVVRSALAWSQNQQAMQSDDHAAKMNRAIKKAAASNSARAKPLSGVCTTEALFFLACNPPESRDCRILSCPCCRKIFTTNKFINFRHLCTARVYDDSDETIWMAGKFQELIDRNKTHRDRPIAISTNEDDPEADPSFAPGTAMPPPVADPLQMLPFRKGHAGPDPESWTDRDPNQDPKIIAKIAELKKTGLKAPRKEVRVDGARRFDLNGRVYARHLRGERPSPASVIAQLDFDDTQIERHPSDLKKFQDVRLEKTSCAKLMNLIYEDPMMLSEYCIDRRDIARQKKEKHFQDALEQTSVYWWSTVNEDDKKTWQKTQLSLFITTWRQKELGEDIRDEVWPF